jgi:mannosyltransferase OCH1-like enzyme
MNNYYLIIIGILILILILILIILFTKKDTFSNSSSDILLEIPDETINAINVTNNKMDGKEIPLNIFMTWNNKDMPINMKKSIEMVMSKNSEFNFYIYDDNDCRNFLKKFFISDVVNAFDSLIPGAYKADLWRYCVLYYYGGIYQDIKFQPVGKFNYTNLLDKEYFVRDIKYSGSGIYNAFIVCKARNEILYKCIKQIIENVKNKFYGSSSLEPTGPLLMKKFFSKQEIDNLELYNKSLLINGIYKDNKKILDFYKNYREEQKKSSKPHYSYLYKIKNIYL